MSDDVSLKSKMNILVKFFEKELNTIDSPLNQPLYHYTTAEGLEGILKSERIWATNIRYLNDSSEHKYAFKLAVDAINCCMGDNVELNKFLEEVLQYIEALENRLDTYITCFCEKGDLLSQWRNYAANGQGFSIGFAPEAFRDLDRKWMSFKMTYNEANHKKTIQELFEKVLLLKDAVPVKNIATGRNIDFCKPELFSKTILCGFLLSYKHPAFSEEAERRIIRLGHPADNDLKASLNFRKLNGLLIPYTEVKLKPIISITAGPTAHRELTKRSIELLLDKYGYDSSKVEIRFSDTPLR